MKTSYGSVEIEMDDGSVLASLCNYGHFICRKMQKADPENANLWTSFTFRIDSLQPQFLFNITEEEMKKEDGEWWEIQTVPVKQD